ncbi:hypothetical protein Desor_5114 [Desulfosporosinus orientis DSM 765]|uniref:Uncharacterized protein n=1 Tax=Desulfosporosinus orientis (strain ATCC 19365 / DSM 765 / NCIMB 8382 / VKM B-1628 / Singapore I) TaxID=768706 RepID=G7WJR6_DESOD|nr:hypothetical protein Desor_5114 [Desulfosporosinus orientis DSM 765]
MLKKVIGRLEGKLGKLWQLLEKWQMNIMTCH